MKIVIAQENQNMIDIAIATTGLPENCWPIMRHNSLEDIEAVPAGTMIEIPLNIPKSQFFKYIESEKINPATD
jgi:hypothetical protein